VHSRSAYISKHSSCTLLYPKLMQAFPLHIYAFPCPQFPGFPSLTMHARVLGLFVLFIKSFIKPPQAIPRWLCVQGQHLLCRNGYLTRTISCRSSASCSTVRG
jgi:hypothetical protein